jgi:alginate O-acetyltransferase complex protein AlgI
MQAILRVRYRTSKVRLSRNMLFNSLPFLYVFLPITYFVFWRLKTLGQRYVWLTLTGYVFYGFWDYRFCALMAASTLISFVAGLGMLRYPSGRARQLCLWMPIAADLSLLGFFKYAGFALSTAQSVAAWLGLDTRFPALQIILPVGISFYTFHTITYIVDCYRGVVQPTRKFFEFSTYVSLFAQLIAGPIVRFRQIERDLHTLDEAEQRRDLERAWSFFAIGLFKKVLIADSIAGVLDPALASVQTLSTADAWLAALGYTYQLYFDFSGYSDMAVGLGLMFGLRLPQNFNSPYKADGPGDFWRRWHISLSTVLRDYLYIPLGGSRHGVFATSRNVLITMLLGGLWHGASWTFVVWGGYHGTLLILERTAGGQRLLPRPMRQAITFFLVIVGWVLFRSTSFAMASTWMARLFTIQAGIPVNNGAVLFVLTAAAAFIAHTAPNTFEISHEWPTVGRIGFAGLFCGVLLSLHAGHVSPFLYFQF